MIPVIDARSLFSGPGSEQTAVDRQIADAAESIGFFCLCGPPELLPTARSAREQLLRVFSLPEIEQHKLWRTFYEPENRNVYRGWNPRDRANGVSIYDLGPDVASTTVAIASSGDDTDPLLGSTPIPFEASLPGWLGAIAAYYRAMERVGAMVMRSVARGLDLPETFFDPAFAGGIFNASTSAVRV
jgi:isopenicillin N synthase-like dioxygenase